MKPLDLVLNENGKWQRVDCSRKRCEWITRPIDWALSLGSLTALLVFAQWFDGNVQWTLPTVMLAFTLAANYVLLLVAFYRVNSDFRLKSQLVSESLYAFYQEHPPQPHEMPSANEIERPAHPELSGGELLCKLEAERWQAERKFWVWLGIVCAIPVGGIAILWAISVFK